MIGKILSRMLLFLNNRGHALITLTGSRCQAELLRQLYFQLRTVLQRLREWDKHIRRPTASSENEGLGAAYDKRKWMEAYYGKQDTAALRRVNGDGRHI
ncbi:hypothetical protein SAMN05216420_10282 [Nitrosospira sp. Nl5]|uniref:hypothetical protein n=1 Tax=Nitrosospira sp. Nl5 TaxID=200120 RepID=UPI00088F3DF9|nr:hypothetical protein [Nitrosospira sp. Nl5]SCY03761.1 hypothetical protein SAMN05216420_10282 [Nitrosospira sp. Nl5]